MASVKEELEIEKLRTEINKMMSEIHKMMSETAKVNKETQKVSKEIRWYEVIIIVSVTLAVVAVAKIFL